MRGDWRRDWGQLSLAIGSYLLAYGLWRATGWGNAQHFTLIADVAFFPLQITGSILAWRASRAPSLDERSRRAWRLIGLAVFALWAGSTASSLYEITGHRVEGLLWPDLLSLSADPLWIAALLSFPTAPRTRTERAKFWLDFAIVTVGAAMVTW